MIDVELNIRNRKIVNMPEFKAAFRYLKDGKHLVTIKDVRKRSLPQNAYYWGVVAPMVLRGLRDAGFDEVENNEDAHEVIKNLFLKKIVVSKQTGDMIEIVGSSAKLSIPEFDEFIDRICKWASEYLGVVIPSPNQEFAMFCDDINNINHEI